MPNSTKPVPDGKKRCTMCGEVKPLDCFYRQAGTPDGKRSRCRRCVSKRRYYGTFN